MQNLYSIICLEVLSSRKYLLHVLFCENKLNLSVTVILLHPSYSVL